MTRAAARAEGLRSTEERQRRLRREKDALQARADAMDAELRRSATSRAVQRERAEEARSWGRVPGACADRPKSKSRVGRVLVSCSICPVRTVESPDPPKPDYPTNTPRP